MASASGGNALSNKLQAMAAALGTGSVADVGFLAGATYPNGKSVPMIAAIMEFGAPRRNIPPRPYFRTMIRQKSGQWPKAIGALLVANNYDAHRTMEMTGAAVKGQLQASIQALTAPPLRPATIARKGFDKPLIETGHMLNTADYRVRD